MRRYATRRRHELPARRDRRRDRGRRRHVRGEIGGELHAQCGHNEKHHEQDGENQGTQAEVAPRSRETMRATPAPCAPPPELAHVTGRRLLSRRFFCLVRFCALHTGDIIPNRRTGRTEDGHRTRRTSWGGCLPVPDADALRAVLAPFCGDRPAGRQTPPLHPAAGYGTLRSFSDNRKRKPCRELNRGNPPRFASPFGSMRPRIVFAPNGAGFFMPNGSENP